MTNANGRTWNDAVIKYQTENVGRSPETVRRENALLRFALPFVNGMSISAIARQDLEKIRLAKLEAGASSRTANYLMQTVGAVLRAAVEWEWIDRAPRLRGIRSRVPKEFFLNSAQVKHLLSILPLHLSRLAEFCLETGLRQGRAKSLEWSRIDFERNRIVYCGSETKNRKPLLVPLTERARLILSSCAGNHRRYVFTYQGRMIAQPTNTAWYSGLRRAGLEGVRFHDLRHTWASWHMAAGTDGVVLQKLGGWSSAQMVSRYAHLSDSAAQRAVRQFEKRRD